MAEETKAPATPEEVVVVVSDVPEAEKPATKEAPVAATPDEKPNKAVVVEGDEATVSQSVSFKEESNIVADLEDPEKKALDELKLLIQEALNKHELSAPPPPPPTPVKEEEEEKPVVAAEDASSSAAAATETTEEVVAPAPPCEDAPKIEEVEIKEPTAAIVDEDGTKTVEAIEETIVPVAKETGEASSAATVEESKEETTPVVVEEATPTPPEEVSIFGIPLLADDRSDVILWKFLRARDFKVKEAFAMIRDTVRWRKEFGIDALVEEEGLGVDLEKVVFMNGFDKEGHPVCYNVYGEFRNKELYQKAFADEDKCKNFLRWRIQFLEKSIRKLDFSPGGISTIVQVNDLKNSPGPFKKELRAATNQAINVLQDYYPEFVAKQIFINVPWWYLAFYSLITHILTLRTKSKFVGASKSAEILFKYIAPEHVPVKYGGLSKEGDHEFSTADAVTEVTIKPATKQTFEFPVSETCQLVWELRVAGWEVSYGAEFVPTAEDGYTVIVQKARKIASTTDEPVICNSFKIGEPGKVVITIDNTSSKKKKLVYRSKTKTSE
ncbi:hypothetical protein GIB67_026221 [Kingdonia uniflora]|uniref:Patellin-3 n=1 Tax=Kingdonia uniflora TaxID=39325 RepID=A0A7J7L9Y9_9MAGN|nr:hypothetical protein GIB67_026221 [Kingdonia uniflora]